MNLNRFKKGFSSTDPERGLRDLPGAMRGDRMGDGTSTIRVKGRYIPGNTDRVGQFFGMMGYVHAWIYAILLPCAIFAGDRFILPPQAIFVIGFAMVHGCAILADGLRNSNAPWATKGIKIFWISTLLLTICGVVASLNRS